MDSLVREGLALGTGDKERQGFLWAGNKKERTGETSWS